MLKAWRDLQVFSRNFVNHKTWCENVFYLTIRYENGNEKHHKWFFEDGKLVFIKEKM